MASTASTTGSTHSLASGGGPTSQGNNTNNSNASNGGMEELLPLVLQLTNAEQVRYDFRVVLVADGDAFEGSMNVQNIHH